MNPLKKICGVANILGAVRADSPNPPAPPSSGAGQTSNPYAAQIYSAQINASYALPTGAATSHPFYKERDTIVCRRLDNGWVVKCGSHERIAVSDDDLGTVVTTIAVAVAMNIEGNG